MTIEAMALALKIVAGCAALVLMGTWLAVERRRRREEADALLLVAIARRLLREREEPHG